MNPSSINSSSSSQLFASLFFPNHFFNLGSYSSSCFSCNWSLNPFSIISSSTDTLFALIASHSSLIYDFSFLFSDSIRSLSFYSRHFLALGLQLCASCISFNPYSNPDHSWLNSSFCYDTLSFFLFYSFLLWFSITELADFSSSSRFPGLTHSVNCSINSSFSSKTFLAALFFHFGFFHAWLRSGFADPSPLF